MIDLDSWFIAGALGVAAAVAAYLGTRPLLREGDALELNRRWLACAKRNLVIALVTFGIATLLLGVPPLVGLLPVLLTPAGAFPVRRRLFEEQWSFLRYLRTFLQVIFVEVGAEILVGLALLMAMGPAPAAPHLAPFLAALAVLRLLAPNVATKLILAATPLHDPALCEHLAAREARTGVPCVKWHVYGPSDGRSLNMIRRSRFGFVSRDAIRRLDLDELAALDVWLAEGANVRRKEWLAYRAVILALALYAFLAPYFPELSGLMPLGALVASFMPLFSLVRRVKLLPTVDRRAAQLCCDAKSLASAWAKVSVNRLPRRDLGELALPLLPDVQKRVHMLRAGATPSSSASAPLGLAEPVVLAARSPARTVVVLDDNRILRFDGIPPDCEHTITAMQSRAAVIRGATYGELQNVRLERRSLKVSDASGAAWSVEIDDADLPRVQSALSILGGRLPEQHGRTFASGLRIVAGSALLLALLGDAPAVTWVAPLLVLWRPTRATALVLAFVAAGLGVPFLSTEAASTLSPLYVIATLAALLVARQLQMKAALSGTRPAITYCLGAAAVYVVPALASIPAWLQVHLIAQRSGVTVMASLAGAAAVLLFAVPRRGGALAAALLLLAGCWGFLGTDAFASHFVDDPLFSVAPPIHSTEVPAGPPLHAIPAGGTAVRLETSPSCQTVAYAERPGADTWTVRSLDGAVRRVEGDALQFVDDRTLLASDHAGLREIDVASGDTKRALTMTPLAEPVLTVSPIGDAWMLCGQDGSYRSACRRGDLEGGTKMESSQPGTRAQSVVMLASGDVLASTWDLATTGDGPRYARWMIGALLNGARSIPQHVTITKGANTRTLFSTGVGLLRCHLHDLKDTSVTCIAVGDDHAVVARVDPTLGGPTDVFNVAGVRFGMHDARPLRDGRLVSSDASHGLLLLDPRSGTAKTLVGLPAPAVFAAGASCVVVRGNGGAEKGLSVYALPE